MTTEHKIVKGTVTIDGQIYKAFENQVFGLWYIVKGESPKDTPVTAGIKAKSATEAIKVWLAIMSSQTRSSQMTTASEKKIITAWITKYALTKGIIESEVEECGNVAGELGGMVALRRAGSLDQYFHGEGKEWHRTYEAALKKADEMRQAKIKSLQKQIAKLQGVEFKEQ
jgi:hypothetical protein